MARLISTSQDPELWDPLGDTLVYLGRQRPQASFRLRSPVLEETGSEFFASVLREGYKGPEDRHVSAPTSVRKSSGLSNSAGESCGDGRPLAPRRMSDLIPSNVHRKAATAIHSLGRKGAQQKRHLPDGTAAEDGVSPVLYELSFPVPAGASQAEVLRHHLATRNVFALLMNKAIVGLDFGQTLKDLHGRLLQYMPPETGCAGMIKRYLVDNELNDVRNDPAIAAGLLAWSEDPSVCWPEGWREGFVHCVGMYPRLSATTEIGGIGLLSQELLERAHDELHVRVGAAEDRLSSFDFHDVWPVGSASPSAARSSFDSFRRFLRHFYEKACKTSPVQGTRENGKGWLTRSLVDRLQRDFGALYDYVVDRDVIWDGSERRSERRPKIVSRTKRATFRADSHDLPMTDLLVTFDDRNGFPHIPHPYPLLPTSIPIENGGKRSLFDFKATKGVDNRTSLSYAEATNVFLLGPRFGRNDLVDAFHKFEKRDQLGKVNPLDARKGRWILLYCILQALADVSVDTPGLWCKGGVSYFLNPRLNGAPPWLSGTNPELEPASRSRSHCWTVHTTWNNVHAIGWSSFQNHRQIVITSEGIGDGIGRDWSSSSDGRTALIDHGRENWSREKSTGGGCAVSGDGDRTPLAPGEGDSDGNPKPRQVRAYQVNAALDVGRSGYVPPEDW